MKNPKKPKPATPLGRFGGLWMLPEPGKLAEGLEALRREREEAEWQRLTTPPKAARPTSVTSVSIARKLTRMRSLLVPFPAGLAPETRTFVAALNAEAERYGIEVILASGPYWIEARGDIDRAAKDPTTLIGWFLCRGDGYLVDQEQVHRKGNSERRKYLRRRAKTKAGMAEAAAMEAEVARQESFIRDVKARHSKFYELLKAIPQSERDRLDLDPAEHRVTRIPLSQRCSFREKPGPEGDTGTQTKGEWKKPLK